MSLSHALDRLLPLIEAELRDIVRIPHHSLTTYYGMMHYHLGWTNASFQPVRTSSGKRLRPILCLLLCEATGCDPELALPAACAIELVHNFSLVHDDIQDRSSYRRGRHAVWDVWGTAHGINVGDGLFVLARLALHRLEQRISPERFQAAVLAFDEACMALCQGQFFDMTFEERLDVDLDQYLWMIRHKTAKLFAASTQLGALVATQNPAEIDAAYRFGANLGMAFQIQDDILGSWGDQGVTGKSTATDIRDKKKTLPIVYTLNHPHDRSLARRLRELYSQTQSLDEADIQAALTILRKAGAREHAEEIADQYYRKAIGHLDGLGFDNDARSCLQELAESLALRQA